MDDLLLELYGRGLVKTLTLDEDWQPLLLTSSRMVHHALLFSGRALPLHVGFPLLNTATRTSIYITCTSGTTYIYKRWLRGRN